MKIKEWVTQARRSVDALDAELLAVYCFGGELLDRSWLVLHDDDEVPPELLEKADKCLAERAVGRPLAQIVGQKEFYGRRFLVRPTVLTPRPETEVLVELVKQLPLAERPLILDVGTGSGCIGITLALELPSSEVWLVDNSPAALEVAKLNNERLGAGAKICQMDLTQDFDFVKGGPVEVLVANLPYLNPEWEFDDERVLSFEPESALFAPGENGLSAYHRLFEQLRAKAVAVAGSVVRYLVVEADPRQQEDLLRMAVEYGWRLLRRDGFGLCFGRDAEQDDRA